MKDKWHAADTTEMKKYVLGIGAFLIIVIGAVLFLRRITAHVALSPQEITLEQQVQIPQKPNNGNPLPSPAVNRLCAPGSSVYLTQVEQDYRKPERKPNPPEVKQAQREGAEAKVSLRVVNSRGIPVPDANIRVSFFHRGSFPFYGKSDSNGYFTASNRSGSDINIYVFKEKHYDTSRRYWFFREGTPCVKDDRWVPWNPTLEIILKEKRKPILLKTKRVTCSFPVNTVVGFDCEQAQLTMPYGSGVCSDMVFNVSGHFASFTNYAFHLTLLPGSNGSSYTRLKMDTFSTLKSVYEAPDVKEFQAELEAIIIYQHDKRPVDTRFKDDEYLVFRSRVNRDETGKIKSANYGKIYNGVRFSITATDTNKASITMSYQFNPTPNDRNLESDDTMSPSIPDWKKNWPKEP